VHAYPGQTAQEDCACLVHCSDIAQEEVDRLLACLGVTTAVLDHRDGDIRELPIDSDDPAWPFLCFRNPDHADDIPLDDLALCNPTRIVAKCDTQAG
jgi:hypothetical protein